MLATAIPLQRLKLITWRNAQAFERNTGVQLMQLAARDGPQVYRADSPGSTRIDAIEHVRRAGIAKRLDHGCATRVAMTAV
jgi:hypothetical protein